MYTLFFSIRVTACPNFWFKIWQAKGQSFFRETEVFLRKPEQRIWKIARFRGIVRFVKCEQPADICISWLLRAQNRPDRGSDRRATGWDSALLPLHISWHIVDHQFYQPLTSITHCPFQSFSITWFSDNFLLDFHETSDVVLPTGAPLNLDFLPFSSRTANMHEQITPWLV